MSQASSPLKIFLCHASADKPKVHQLYNYLRDQGLKPWLDVEDLLPGQQWQAEIPKALKASDVIIICLSRQSVSKEGYVQKEIKFALDKTLEIPDGRIFLIPAKLEECDVPDSLGRYHWVNLFEEDGYTKLEKSLIARAEQITLSQTETSLLDEIEVFPAVSSGKIDEILDGKEIYREISILNEILKDSSPEVIEAGMNYMSEYKILVERVSSVQGANFPDIIS